MSKKLVEFECSSSPSLPDDGTEEAAEDGDSRDTQSEEDAVDVDGCRIFPRIRAPVLKRTGGDSELYDVKYCSRTRNDDDVVVVVDDEDDKGKRNATEVLESATTATRPTSAAVDSTDSGDDDDDGNNNSCRLRVTIVVVFFMLWHLLHQTSNRS